MTTVGMLLAAAGLPVAGAAAWPIHLGWLGALALAGFAGLGVSVLVNRPAPTPAGAATPGCRESGLREAA